MLITLSSFFNILLTLIPTYNDAKYIVNELKTIALLTLHYNNNDLNLHSTHDIRVMWLIYNLHQKQHRVPFPTKYRLNKTARYCTKRNIVWKINKCCAVLFGLNCTTMSILIVEKLTIVHFDTNMYLIICVPCEVSPVQLRRYTIQGSIPG